MKLNEVRDLLRNVEEQIAAAIGVLDRTLAHAPTDGGHRGYFAVGKSSLQTNCLRNGRIPFTQVGHLPRIPDCSYTP